jgi:ADP-ribose pyrophosphatase YjhB (NUDIX family)
MATPEFVLELRAMIGNHPLWLPGITALVTDEQGRVLMGRRADNGRWALPSGISEPGETMAAACAREVLEETGVEVEVEHLIALRTEGPVVYPNGDVTSYADTFFGCRPIGGTARVADDESLEVGWFDPSDLPEPGTPRTGDLLALAARYEATGRTQF